MMSNQPLKVPYTICTPWELPDTCSTLVNRYYLYPMVKSDNTKEKEEIMFSHHFKSESVTRHVALKSIHPHFTVGHVDLFQSLEPFEIRCIYPYITAGITILSFYKLSDAQKSIQLIQDKFNHVYKEVCFVNPCVLDKTSNEQLFITLSYPTPFEQQDMDYMELLSSLDKIYTMSEANTTQRFKMIHLEFDDERTVQKVLKKYKDVVVEQDVRIQSFRAAYPMCTCIKEIKKKTLSIDNKNFIHSNNYSFFSIDPFPITQEEQIQSPISSTISTCSSNESWKGSCTKRESYDSTITMTTLSNNSSTCSLNTITAKKNIVDKKDEPNSFNIERIKNGQDTRTTFMIRNIPNKYTQQMLMDCINETHANTYDFLYLRIDFKNKCNVGYAFINFINVESVISFFEDRVGKRWKLFNSDKKCSLSYANIQGKEALIKKFKNSQVMEEDDTYRPKLFYTRGLNKGKEEPFPKPDDNNMKADAKKHARHVRHHQRKR